MRLPIADLTETTDDESDALLESYATSVGRAAYSWNLLQQFIGLIFSIVCSAGTGNIHSIAALSLVWHSQQSDRNQRRMLRAALGFNDPEKLHKKLTKKNVEDLLWLLAKSDELSAKRDEIIHAPIQVSGAPGSRKLTTMSEYGNDLATRLSNKDINIEVSLCDWRASHLTGFSLEIYQSLLHEHSPWPNKQPKLDRELHRQLMKQDHQ